MNAEVNGGNILKSPPSLPTKQSARKSGSSDAIAHSNYFHTLLQVGILSTCVFNITGGTVAAAPAAPSPVQNHAVQASSKIWTLAQQTTLRATELSNLLTSSQPISEFDGETVSTEVFDSTSQVQSLRIEQEFESSSENDARAIAQASPPDTNSPSVTTVSGKIRRQGSEILGKPSIQLQGVYVLQGNESSARGRVNALYPVSPTALFGAVVDVTTGDAFSDSPGSGVRLNELYFAYAPFDQLPGLRFVVGLMDLTSYFDRNSFAKDGASQFFNRAFQTNPALSAAGLASRPGLLMNWSISDNVEIKATGFSSRRNLGSFSLDSFAAEAGFRAGNLILRGTFITSRDAGQDTGFEEIYSLPRSGGFGVLDGDRENAFGLNGEYYIPNLKLGFFVRYGWYNNVSLGEGGTTYSFGATRLDLFMRNDRLGIAYGRQLSNNDLRRDRDDKIPDVLEIYYDFPVAKFLRLGVTFQERNQFSESIFGFRIKTEFNVLGRLFE